jgi:hypothetical protein
MVLCNRRRIESSLLPLTKLLDVTIIALKIIRPVILYYPRSIYEPVMNSLFVLFSALFSLFLSFFLSFVHLSFQFVFCRATRTFQRVFYELRDIYNYEIIIHLFLGVPLRTVYRRFAERLRWAWLYSLNRHSSDCRTPSKIWGLFWICSKAACIRTISSSVVSTGVAFTTLFTCLQRKYLGILSSRVIALATQIKEVHSRWTITKKC